MKYTVGQCSYYYHLYHNTERSFATVTLGSPWGQELNNRMREEFYLRDDTKKISWDDGRLRATVYRTSCSWAAAAIEDDNRFK